MTSLPSQISIYNAAMAELGHIAHITSISEPAAARANVLWDDLSAAMLEDYPWNFLIGRATLNATSDSLLDSETDEFQTACHLPANCARWLPPARGEPNYFLGEREGQFLLIDCAAPVRIRFIRNDVTIGEWPRYFARVMSAVLAAALAEGVTQSESIKANMIELTERRLRRAKTLDALEGGGQRRVGVSVKSEWLDARRRPYAHFGR